jgi:hypothetical protein
MDRILKPCNVTSSTIESLDWDFIILDKQIDIEALQNWYNIVKNNLDHLKFNFQTCSKYIKDSVNNKFTTDTNDYKWERNKRYEKLQNSWTLTWPTQRDVPLPPPWAANLDFFIELCDYFDSVGNIIKDFDYYNNENLNQYYFGEWKKIIDEISSYIYNPRITQHMPEHILHPHTDGYIARLHIPMTYDNSKFYWGEKWNREYNFEPGNVYIINSRIPHSTTNFSSSPRGNIIADIREETIMDLVAWK